MVSSFEHFFLYFCLLRPDSSPGKLKEIPSSQAVSAADLEAQWQQEEEEKRRVEEKKREEEERAKLEEEERIVSIIIVILSLWEKICKSTLRK